jgi:hypothetical protein
MQFGHVALALSIATYDWSIGNAVFCLGMHYLPNVDSLIVKAGWDKKIIKGAIKLESSLGKKYANKPAEENPQNDPFWVDCGGFHCTVTHSIFFAIAVSLIIALFSWHYAAFALVAILAHYAADIGSTVGLPLLWPFTRKKYTLALFRDTGWWGKDMFVGYYSQPVPWLLEGMVSIFLVYRLMII